MASSNVLYPDSESSTYSAPTSDATLDGSSDYCLPSEWDATSYLLVRRRKARGSSSNYVPEWNPACKAASESSSDDDLVSDFPLSRMPGTWRARNNPSSKGSAVLCYETPGPSPPQLSSISSYGMCRNTSFAHPSLGARQDGSLSHMPGTSLSFVSDGEGPDPVAEPTPQIPPKSARIPRKARNFHLWKSKLGRQQFMPRHSGCSIQSAHVAPSSSKRPATKLPHRARRALVTEITAPVKLTSARTLPFPSTALGPSTSWVARIWRLAMMKNQFWQPMRAAQRKIILLFAVILLYLLLYSAPRGSLKAVESVPGGSIRELVTLGSTYHVERVRVELRRLPGHWGERLHLTIDSPPPNVSIDGTPNLIKKSALSKEAARTVIIASTETWSLKTETEAFAQTSVLDEPVSERPPPHGAVLTAALPITPRFSSNTADDKSSDSTTDSKPTVDPKDGARGGFLASLRQSLWRHHLKVLYNARKTREAAMSKVVRSFRDREQDAASYLQ